LIVDEAHHLEDEATAQLGWRIALRELLANLDRLWEVGPTHLSGLIPQAIALMARQTPPPEALWLERLSSTLGFAIGDLADELQLGFEALKQFTLRHGDRSEAAAQTSRLSAAARSQPAWSEVEIAWDQCNGRLVRLQRVLGELLAALETAEADEEWEQLTAELAALSSYWDTAQERLWSTIMEADPGTIAWLSLSRSDELSVNAAPLHVGERLQQSLFREKNCVVLTSATLTADGSFRYLRERLGIEEARETVLGSPFDYRRAALVYLPSDLPEPNAPGYQASVERLTGQLIAVLEGRTLVLFTSHSQLRTTYQALKESLEARQILLLGQRMDGASRSRLLESFKGGDRVALMGTSSFWEGVDVVGAALSCLVIARLPFTAPSDPVFQARSEAFEDPFGQYAVPQAILRFRQGFGRLIRSRADRGAVVVLDRRIRSRGYGRAFLRSLPDCELQEGPAARTAAAVRDWLENPPALVAAPVDQRPDGGRRLLDLER
jgi:DNA polymerase-3 subunit epsilon/ATP-dependent DNA helicase DinG